MKPSRCLDFYSDIIVKTVFLFVQCTKWVLILTKKKEKKNMNYMSFKKHQLRILHCTENSESIVHTQHVQNLKTCAVGNNFKRSGFMFF